MNRRRRVAERGIARVGRVGAGRTRRRDCLKSRHVAVFERSCERLIALEVKQSGQYVPEELFMLKHKRVMDVKTKQL